MLFVGVCVTTVVVVIMGEAVTVGRVEEDVFGKLACVGVNGIFNVFRELDTTVSASTFKCSL